MADENGQGDEFPYDDTKEEFGQLLEEAAPEGTAMESDAPAAVSHDGAVTSMVLEGEGQWRLTVDLDSEFADLLRHTAEKRDDNPVSFTLSQLTAYAENNLDEP